MQSPNMAVESGNMNLQLVQSQKYSDMARFKSRTDKKHEVKTENIEPSSDYSTSFRRDLIGKIADTKLSGPRSSSIMNSHLNVVE